MLFDSEWWRAEYLGPTSREPEQWDLEGFVRGSRTGRAIARRTRARARHAEPPPPPPSHLRQMNLDRWGRREWVIALPLQGIFTHADPWKYKETAQ